MTETKAAVVVVVIVLVTVVVVEAVEVSAFDTETAKQTKNMTTTNGTIWLRLFSLSFPPRLFPSHIFTSTLISRDHFSENP